MSRAVYAVVAIALACAGASAAFAGAELGDTSLRVAGVVLAWCAAGVALDAP